MNFICTVRKTVRKLQIFLCPVFYLLVKSKQAFCCKFLLTLMYFSLSLFSFSILQLFYLSLSDHLSSFLFSPAVFACSCLFSLLFFSLPSPIIWCSLLSFPLTFLPAPSFLPSLLHQIFRLFLVSTSLIPMPHYRLMAPTVGFSPPLRVTLTFLTPTSAYITPLFSVRPLFDCCLLFCIFFKNSFRAVVS